ncbi:MAG: SCO family protein [Armatimonadota bacterium]|nr:SCO family protein [Armatimonadota bacterium]
MLAGLDGAGAQRPPRKPLGAALVAALVVVVAGAMRFGGPAPPIWGAPAGAASAEATAPDFALINQDGQRVTLRQFLGKIVLMNFIYTHCTDVCPLAQLKLARVQEDLKARGWFGTRVVFLSVTFDPARDTPAVMKAYARRFRADPAGWHFLTGPPHVVDRVLKAYRIPVRAVGATGSFEHALPTLVIDGRGVVLGHYEPDFTPANVARDLARLLGP